MCGAVSGDVCRDGCGDDLLRSANIAVDGGQGAGRLDTTQEETMALLRDTKRTCSVEVI